MSLVQIKSTPGDFENNTNRAFIYLEAALKNNPDIICLPELWSSGYDTNKSNLPKYHKKNLSLKKALSEFAKKNNIILCAGSFITKEGNNYYNRFKVFNRAGKEIAWFDKMHLFESFGEKGMFKRGEEPQIVEIGDGWKAGLMICYDIRFPELAREYYMRGCNLIIAPSQWPGIRYEHWSKLISARSIENQCFFAACNISCIEEKEYVFGHSLITDPWGNIIAEAGQEDGVISAVLDPDMIKYTLEKFPIAKDIHPYFRKSVKKKA